MFFKLGKKASSFVDTASGKKLAAVIKGAKDDDGDEVPVQVIELDAREMRSQRVRMAIKGGHIVKCDKDGRSDSDEDEDDSEVDEVLISQKQFDKLKVDDKKTYLTTNFELEQDDVDEIDEMTGAELNSKYAELNDEGDDD